MGINKRDLYLGENGLLLLLRIDSVTEMILMLYASVVHAQVCVCACVSVSFCVFALECFADQMHLLFNSPSQQAALTKYMHALAHARPHNLRYKHTERGMNMEMKTRQVCKYLDLGAGDGLQGTAESMANRGRLGSCSFAHVSAAVQMSVCLTAHKMHANVCFVFLFFFSLLRVGFDHKLFCVGC